MTTGARLASFLATIGLLSLLTQGTQEMLDLQQHPGISPTNAASSDVVGVSSSAGNLAEDRHDQRDDVQVEDEISNPLAWGLANSKRMVHIPNHHQLRFSNMQLTLLLRNIDTMSSNLDSSSSSSSSSSATYDHPPPPSTAAEASDAAGAVREEMSEQGQSQSRDNEERVLVKKRMDDGEAVVTSAETHDKVGRAMNAPRVRLNNWRKSIYFIG